MRAKKKEPPPLRACLKVTQERSVLLACSLSKRLLGSGDGLLLAQDSQPEAVLGLRFIEVLIPVHHGDCKRAWW